MLRVLAAKGSMKADALRQSSGKAVDQDTYAWDAAGPDLEAEVAEAVERVEGAERELLERAGQRLLGRHHVYAVKGSAALFDPRVVAPVLG